MENMEKIVNNIFKWSVCVICTIFFLMILECSRREVIYDENASVVPIKMVFKIPEYDFYRYYAIVNYKCETKEIEITKEKYDLFNLVKNNSIKIKIPYESNFTMYFFMVGLIYFSFVLFLVIIHFVVTK